MIKLKNILEGKETHPELGNFDKGLFSVPLNNKSINMLDHVGSWCVYKNFDQRRGTISKLPYKILHLQKNHRGDVIFRGENQLDTFGKPIDPSDIKIVSEEEARKIWNETVDVVNGSFVEFDPEFDSR